MVSEVKKQEEKVENEIPEERREVDVEAVIEEIRTKLNELSDAVMRLTEAINVSVDVQRGLKEAVEKAIESLPKRETLNIEKSAGVAVTPRPTVAGKAEDDLLKDVLSGKFDWGSLSERLKKKRMGEGL